LKCFEISLIFHGLLLWLQKKIDMKIFMNQSQESLGKNSWVPIAMLCNHIINFLLIQFDMILSKHHFKHMYCFLLRASHSIWTETWKVWDLLYCTFNDFDDK
jgi:hypothetical protein